jgi:oxygen-independent coproporphyrinogen-3 oxidase
MVTPALTAECVAELSTRGPRYTSYPPATELAPISTATVERELETLPIDGPISLYLHIPFCKSLCWYCGCNVIPSRDSSRGDRYVETLATEMALVAKALHPAYPVSEIALGGGSPNFLSPRTMRKLVMLLERCFGVLPDARRSVELDPREATFEQIDTLATLGFRALSVGVQDFAGPVQDAIHRHQSRAQTAWLIAKARDAGFTDINVDMVYGLPRQNETSFTRTLDAVVQLEPDRIALFGYAHLPSKLPHQALVERAGRVLDRFERATLLLMAIERLTAAGYVHIGLDHFARPGSTLARAAAEHRMIRTFQGYVEYRADSVIGLGTSAVSTTKRMFWQNHSDLPAWEAAILAGKLPIARGFVLDRDDQIRRTVIGRLMCDGSIDLGRIEDEFQISAPSYFDKELVELRQLDDLASYDAATNAIVTTPLGRLLVRNVCMVFDAYQQPAAPGEAKFSSTI